MPHESKSMQTFQFDKIFNHNKSNEDVYKAECEHLINKSLQGFNCSIICYGGI